MTTFYVVRHGESEGNAAYDAGDVTYSSESELGSDLTKVGIKQANSIAQDLKNVHFHKIFSSDFLRAKHTAEVIALERSLAVEAIELIRERNYGSLNGKMTKEVRDSMKKELAALTDLEKMKYKHVSDMESPEEAATRLIIFLRETALAYPNKTILVVAHGNLMRSFLVHIGFAKYDELPRGTVTNAGYLILECDGVEFFIKDTHGIHKKEIN